VLDVVVGEVEVGIHAVEDDDVEIGVLLDKGDELPEFGDGRRGDRVDRRVVERHPAIAAAATVDAQMRPRAGPRVGAPTIAGCAVAGVHGELPGDGVNGDEPPRRRRGSPP
jgi:hypothetical protein